MREEETKNFLPSVGSGGVVFLPSFKERNGGEDGWRSWPWPGWMEKTGEGMRE